MGFEVFWYYKPRIVQVISHGDFTVENIEKIERQLVAQFFYAANQPVHLLMDVRAMIRFPIREARATTLFEQILRHSACGRLVVIRADNPVQFFVMSSITQMLGNRFRQARSLNDAVLLLKGCDTTLHKIAI
jgi:hypothetical protein